MARSSDNLVFSAEAVEEETKPLTSNRVSGEAFNFARKARSSLAPSEVSFKELAAKGSSTVFGRGEIGEGCGAVDRAF